MEELTLKRLKEINNVKDFLEYIKPYYPDINIVKETIVEIEKALFHTYIKLIGRILYYSPLNMRKFLKAFLLKYEIRNILEIIIGSIIGKSRKEKVKNINFLVEEYLENTDFINDLLEMTSLEEIQFFLKNTKYYTAIREGILYFKKNNEIFVLESFLDRLYYKNLLKSQPIYKKQEKTMITHFVGYKTEIYNLNMIYRGIRNNIDKKLLSQFLIDNYLFLNEEIMEILLNVNNTDDFFIKLEEFFKKNEEIKSLFIPIVLNEKHLKWSLEGLYQNYYFKKFQVKNDDISYLTIYRILELMLRKEKEIIFDIMPNIIKILHDKYEILEDRYGNI
ncbi:MAG: V-type ATPase subunit [Candidatus Hodarchaeota archaeon]